MNLMEIDKALTLALNGSDSLYLDGIAWIATQTATWIPLAALLLYLVIRNNGLRGVIGTIIAIALAITLADQVASTIFKPLVARPRPTHDPELMYLIDIVNGYRGGKYGFFSSHAANTMAVATLVSLIFRDRTLTAWLYSWALLNCWTRVYLGVHYVGDLLVGTLWGLFVGWIIFRLWLRYCPGVLERRTLSRNNTRLTTGGYSLGSVHLLTAGIVITYLYVALRALQFT